MEDTARLLSELRGGTWGVLGDRDAVRAIEAAWPRARDAIRRHDRFRSAVAEDAVRRGVATVVLAEVGFPDGDPPHLAAARARPPALFVYADRGSVVSSQRRLALEGLRAMGTPGGHVTAVAADVREPRKLLRRAGLLSADGEWLGDGPLQLQFGLAALEMSRTEAAAVTAGYTGLLPSRSEIVIAVADGWEGSRFAKLAGLRAHDASDLAAWIRRAGLKSGPPFDIRGYGRRALGNALRADGGRIMAAVATVP